MIAITTADYECDYRIKLKFNTGEEGVVDLSDLIEKYAVAQPLKNINEFKKFFLDEWPTLAWSCGFDVSPETLYERATGKCIKWLEKPQVS
jgi:activator of HSP90 ATPase